MTLFWPWPTSRQGQILAHVLLNRENCSKVIQWNKSKLAEISKLTEDPCLYFVCPYPEAIISSIFSDATWSIDFKFYMEPPWKEGAPFE